MKKTAGKKYECEFCGDMILKGQKYYRNLIGRLTEKYDTKECMTAMANERKGIKLEKPEYIR